MLKIYQTWSIDGEGDDISNCIAATSHEEAVDVLIEMTARNYASCQSGFIEDFELTDMFEDRTWLGIHDERCRPVDHVAVYELRMPSEPGPTDYHDRRVVTFDLEEVLKRRGVSDPSFDVNAWND